MTQPPAPQIARQRRRNRRMLVLLCVVFLGSFVLAGALRFSGWRPAGSKNKGELLEPPADLRRFSPELSAGGRYRWNPAERVWRILVVPPADCGAPCRRLSAQLDIVWRLFGHDADRVHLLWLGEPPDGATMGPALRVLRDDPRLRAALPRQWDWRGTPVYVIDPNGFVILRHAPGFDPGDLRGDMARLLKLR